TTVKPVKITGPVSTKEQATYNLAESYRMLHFHEKAEPLYSEAMSFDRAQFPEVQFHYATTLRAMQKYPEAEANFKEFAASTNNTDLKKDAEKEVASLQFSATQTEKTDMSQYTVVKAQKSLADTGAVYAPVWYGNTLYFTSSKPVKDAARTQVNNTRIYQASLTDSGFGGISNAAVPEAKDVHQGAVTLSPDGNKMIFSRWTIGDGKKASSLYMTKKTDGTWSEPIAMPASINQEGYNAQQPVLMPDGKTLVYSSDIPGGVGGFDLWSVTLDELDNAGTPTNLGPFINTNGDEHAPFYHVPSKTLVFSSNGRVGMGGFDFYYSKGDAGNWGEVKNFGYPVNSHKDDVYFASRGRATNILEDVLFASDRDAACCLELFTLKKKNMPKTISGMIVSCETKDTQTTGADGKYTFTIEDYQPLKAVASAPEHQSGELGFNEPTEPGSLTLNNPDICLQPIVIDKPVVVNNIYYDFDKAELREESYPELDKLVTMFEANPDIKVEISAHTDNIGKHAYNQRLSEARARSVVNYLVKKGIKRSQLISKGYAATQPIAENQNADGTDNPEGRQQNRRTEFKVLK
ncbi:MAG: flagellar motor protein MotB, partial [Sphingobacteriales bacterium]